MASKPGKPRFSKKDIEFHGSFNTPYGPAINVKVHNFGGHGNELADYFKVNEMKDRMEELMEGGEDKVQEEWEQAVQWAFESQQETFWDGVQEYGQLILEEVFGPVKIYSEGRSGGWLVVHSAYGNNGKIATRQEVDDEWDAIKVSCWGRFSQAIKADVEWLSSFEQVKELIEANEWFAPMKEEEKASV